MTVSHQYELSAIDLSGTQYSVEQTGRDKTFRPEYEPRDVTGDTLFRGTYQIYEEKDEFPFVDAGGNEIFTVKAGSTWDIAGDYLLTDSQTEEDLIVLDNDFSLFQDPGGSATPLTGRSSRKSTRAAHSSLLVERSCRLASGSLTSTR